MNLKWHADKHKVIIREICFAQIFWVIRIERLRCLLCLFKHRRPRQKTKIVKISIYVGRSFVFVMALRILEMVSEFLEIEILQWPKIVSEAIFRGTREEM